VSRSQSADAVAAESTEDRILAALDPEQREAVTAVRGPVCILAGAGTGKTRAITHRIAYGVLTGALPPAQVLAVTFTARAAGELRSRLRELGVGGVQARTFHAAALRQLGYFWPRAVGGELPRIVENKYQLVANAAARTGLRPSREQIRDLLGEIEWAKSSLVSVEGYPAAASRAHREPPFESVQVAAVLAGYEELKAKQSVLDFDDLLLLTAGVIADHPDVAAELRARYRHFVVDEYQDVNPLQQQLLDAWLGDRDDLCVVGDAQQTIYSFAGASPSYLLEFPRRYPDATVVRLVRDYRSTPQVVALANSVVADAAPTGARLRLEAQRPPGPAPTFTEYDDEPAEAAAVTRRCLALVAAGTPASEIAVLYRVNAQSPAYEQALAAANLPYVLRGGERFFDRPEVRESMLLLRAAARAADGDAPGTLVGAVTDALGAVGFVAGSPPAGGGAARDRWESLAALARLAEDFAASRPDSALPEFVAELAERSAAQHAPTVDGVTLASLHAAKGLEWDAVFLVGLVDGTVPITHAVTPAQIEEERRLLYVGITRAREHLHLSWALSRAAGGRRGRRPSRFLDGMVGLPGRAGGRSARPGRATKGLAQCRVCGRPLTAPVERKLRRCAGCPASRDEALFERLREWRSERAKAQAQPAFVVFTDATLTAIAESRPVTVAELVAIPGIGQAKLDRYGADVLTLVAETDAGTGGTGSGDASPGGK
jgi:DNA helicase-2/ATP-dependent DNA helicase PcrA